MLDGLTFRMREEQKLLGLAVSWGINFAFADKSDKSKMLAEMGVDVSEGKPTKEEIEERRERSKRLLRKIETAQIGKRQIMGLDKLKDVL